MARARLPLCRRNLRENHAKHCPYSRAVSAWGGACRNSRVSGGGPLLVWERLRISYHWRHSGIGDRRDNGIGRCRSTIDNDPTDEVDSNGRGGQICIQGAGSRNISDTRIQGGLSREERGRASTCGRVNRGYDCTTGFTLRGQTPWIPIRSGTHGGFNRDRFVG